MAAEKAKNVWKYDYLGQDIIRGFDSYKYNSVDTSPLSNYVMHPFWNAVVKLCPMWIAPNLLTFVGFICCVGHYAVTSFFDYDFRASQMGSSNPIPSWAWFLTSFLLFASHTLDGIDGKQARRTGTSGPLGELFDHGCDAWATVFIAATFYSLFGRNEDGYSITVFRMYLIIWAVFFVFHIAHWEKYNTGVLFLPWSYDMAMLMGTVLYATTGALGHEIWKVKLPGDYSAGPVLEVILYVCCYGFSFGMTLNNIIKSYKEKTGKMRPFGEAVRPLISLFICGILCISWASLSPSNILDRDPRMFMLMSGSIYANMSCRLIVAQMSQTRCEALNYLLFPLLISFLLSVSILRESPGTEMAVLISLMVFTTSVHIHYVSNVIRQMCDYLKIEAFRIKNIYTESRKKAQ